MFDVGGGELLVIGIVALVVIGPKELPGLLRTAGNAMNKVRRMAAEFRGQFDEAMREAELDQAKKAFTDMNDAAQSAKPAFNPLDTIRSEIQSVKDDLKTTREAQAAAGQPQPEVKLDPPPPAPPVAITPDPPPAAIEAEPPKPKRSRKKVAGDGAAA
jgi:sec-independent protein translocase protein TatB